MRAEPDKGVFIVKNAKLAEVVQAKTVERLAHSINEAADRGPLKRTSIYEAIKSGRLRARKFGSSTIILDEDLRAFYASLPLVGEVA